MSYERLYAGETTVVTGKLETAAGVAVTEAQISDVRVIGVDSASGATVNGRDADTNHKGDYASANLTIGTSDGNVELEVQPEDTNLLSPANGGEDHQFTLRFTFDAQDGDGDQVKEFRQRIYCGSFLGLTDFDEVLLLAPELKNSDGEVSDDDRFLVELMIDAVTARLEMECDRVFLKATTENPAVEIFSPGENCGAVDLKRWPVTKADIVSVKEDADGLFPVSLTAVDSTAYGMTTERSLRRKNSFWLEGIESLRVEHNGGMARHTGGVKAHIRHAAATQVATWFKLRDKLGKQAESVHGHNVTTYFKGGLVKEVKDLIPMLRGRMPL